MPDNPKPSAVKKTEYHQLNAREALTMTGLALVTGLLSATSAIVLSSAVHFAIHFFTAWHGTIWMVFIPGAGAALSAYYLRNILKDNSGHGVPDLIKGATLGRGILPRHMIYSRLISSFLTVGSGGSAGLEGPIVTSGGGIGSAFGRWMRVSERKRSLLLAYGVAGAIAAIFNAPLTGIVFAMEIILGQWTAMTVLPVIVSAVTATQFSRLILGNQIPFGHDVYAFHTLDLAAAVILGLITGLASVGFARSLFQSELFFSKFRIPEYIKAGLGGVMVGLLGYNHPEVLHDGYNMIRLYLSGPENITILSIGIFLVIKIIAVLLTLGSGGSGGIFAPGLVIGSALGFGFGTLLDAAKPFLQMMDPTLSTAHPSLFALIGMAGMIAALMHAPLTAMFLVLEITGSYQLILPLMLTSAMAMLASNYFEIGSVYTRNLMSGGYLARKGSDLHLLQTMEIHELLDSNTAVISEDMLLEDFIEIFKKANRNIFPVIERGTGVWLGLVYLDDIRPYLFDRNLYRIMTMGEILRRNIPYIEATESPLTAIQKFEDSGAWSLPVVNNGLYVGMVSKSTLFDRYRRELIVHTD